MLSTVSFLLFLVIPVPAARDPIGTLEINVMFSNPKAKLPNGESCDSFIWNFKCDIFLTICLSEADRIGECNLYYERTKPAANVESISNSFVVDYASDRTINMEIRAMDNDRLSDPDLIGTYTYSFLPSALSSWEHIYPNNRGNAHSSTKMYVKIRRTCKPHHFGPSCIPCHIPKARGTCDFNGFPICNAGYSGPECSQHNFCRDSSPCAPFAVCENTEDSFICLCDGTSGKRCEVGFDPCSEHICLHNGTCIAVGENRNFAECINCDVGWSGLHCEEKADACTEEERRLGRPPCANGGHCVSRMNGTVLTCLCEDGWQGPRCEMAFTTVSVILVAIAICIVALVAGCIFAFVWCFRVYLLPKLRSITKPRGVEMQPVKVDLNGDLWKANNLYEEMGNKSATGGKKLLESLDYDLPSSKSVDDADYEDYEAMAIQQCNPIHKAFTPVPASESFDNEEYEPVSMRAHDGGLVTQTPEPGSAYLNNEEYETVSETTDYRPLPAPPMGSNAKAFL